MIGGDPTVFSDVIVVSNAVEPHVRIIRVVTL